MKLITSIDQIDAALNEPGFWTLEKLQILDELYKAANKTRKITRPLLNELNGQLAQRLDELTEITRISPKLSVTQKHSVNEVLERLQDQGWHVVYYPLPSKKSRSSVMPSEPWDLIYWRNLEHWRARFWSQWIEKPDKLDVTLALVLELNASLGVNSRMLKQAINRLTDANVKNGEISIPVIEDETTAMLTLPLNARFQLLWRWYVSTYTDPITLWKDQTKNLAPLLKKIINTNNDKNPQQRRKGRWSKRLLGAAAFSLVENGLEPFISNVLKADILPLSPPDPDHGFGFSLTDATWPLLIKRLQPAYALEKPISIKLSSNLPTSSSEAFIQSATFNAETSSSEFYLDGTMVKQIAWLPACQHAARTLQAKLRKACTDEQGHYRNQKLEQDKVNKILDGIKTTCFDWIRWNLSELPIRERDKASLDEFINQIEKGFSTLDLMIEWTRHRLTVERITASTLSQDLRLVFSKGLFWYECSADLLNWDDEDVEILLSDHLIPGNSNPLAQSRALNTLARIADWARASFGCFQTVFFLTASAKGVRLTRRNHIIGLQEHDLLQSKIRPNNTPHCEQVKAILDLAFYAGMRSGEIANLRLGQVVCNNKELVLYLSAFKTPSAYRSIHFHLLAPPAAINRVKKAIHTRSIEYRKYKNRLKGDAFITKRETLLFSMDGDIINASAIAMVAHARDILKSWLGSGADLHLGRHSFASHLVLRWYCLRHPDLINQLRESKHYLFSPQGLRNLKYHLGEPADIEAAKYAVASLIHIIKIMGHKTIHTLFQVYVHSFETIAAHALKKAQQFDNQAQLSGKAISLLVPGAKSRTTQAKIKDKSASGVLEWLVDSVEKYDRKDIE